MHWIAVGFKLAIGGMAAFLFACAVVYVIGKILGDR